MPERRELSFERLEQVMPEVDRLLDGGYDRAGQWSLGQICQHLSRTFRSTIEPEPRGAPRVIRATLGSWLFRHMVRTGRMKSGVPGPRGFMPDTAVEDRAGAEELRDMIPQFLERLPQTFDHPFFGRVSRDDFLRLQCVHCAHHLSYAIPRVPAGGDPHVAAANRPS
jgi:hypothetical protein